MKREVLTEIKLRALKKQGINQVAITEGTLVTPSARDFARQAGITVTVNEASVATSAPSKTAGKYTPPVAPKGSFTNSYTGESLDAKPEHFTHLQGNVLVQKNHPRIAFRGQIDKIQAYVVEAQILAKQEKIPALESDLDDVLKLLREIMRAEVRDVPLADVPVFGLTVEQLREASHNPAKFFNTGHTLADKNSSMAVARINIMRTIVREAEITALDAFAGGVTLKPERSDILTAMNRLSSAFYILMCKYSGGSE